MALVKVKIQNFKSIKSTVVTLKNLNLLIGENGSGKTNILEAIEYFYNNLTASNLRTDIFDLNNPFSNEVRITLYFDFSEFVKISKAQTDLSLDRFSDSDTDATPQKHGGYYTKIIALAAAASDKVLSVQLTQLKGKGIKWNYAYSDRLIFKSLFPLFFIDTRNLDVEKWDYVWNVLGELAKVSNAERKEIEKKISSLVSAESREMSKKIKDINDIFSEAGVSIKPDTSKDFASTLIKLYLSGQAINQNGKQLNYYSTGTNTVKYLELLLRAIDAISKAKMKEPIILLDEPEISLHPRLIDELSDAIVSTNSKKNILLSTHSSRLAKNLIVHANEIALYDVRLTGKYSTAYKMKLFPQYSPTSTARVTDDHVNSYFSRAILFVEGESELELFSNLIFREIFPKTKYLDVYQAMSNKPVLNIMHPQKTNSSIPYICLIDMDKAVAFDTKSKKYTLKGEYFKDNSKEPFQYYNKQQNEQHVYHQRLRINAMAQKLHIHYFKPYWSTTDPNHFTFQESVHNYLLKYNIFTLSTTIEGALVNEITFNYALDFLKDQVSATAYEAFEGYLNSIPKTDRLNAIRIAFNGKSDLWQTPTQIRKTVTEDIRKILDDVPVGKKTSGWFTKYLENFYAKMMGESEFSIDSFRKFLKTPEHREAVQASFQKNFPELFELFDKICDMI